MENLEIYNRYRNVPKEALKPFDNGNFKGTDINSMWRIKCLTEQFGVVGHGWTVKVLRTWTERDENTQDILAFAEIEMKVKIDGEWGEPFTATGGNKLSTYVKSKDYFKSSDEAFKMAITDAFGVACKYLGIGADVYFANDKSKYTKDEPDKPNKQEPKKEMPFKQEEPKPLTLAEAKKMGFTAGGKEYIVETMTDEQLLAMKDYTKLPRLAEACAMELEDRARVKNGER